SNIVSRYSSSSIPYLRRVPVGGLRFSSWSDNVDYKINQSVNLPLIPPDVEPRIREIYSPPAADDGKVPEKPPLLLLNPYLQRQADEKNPGNAFFFLVYRPAIDLNTWDRWVVSPQTKQARINIWADYHQNALGKQGQSARLAIEDPA